MKIIITRDEAKEIIEQALHAQLEWTENGELEGVADIMAVPSLAPISPLLSPSQTVAYGCIQTPYYPVPTIGIGTGE